MTVQPGSARWDELVQQGIIIDGRRNWFLGDAALEIAPMGDNTAHNDAVRHLSRYADEVGIEYEAIKKYRAVAHAWPQGIRIPRACWSAHQVLMAADKRHLLREGMSAIEARKAAGVSTSGNVRGNSPPEDKAQLVRDYLADPEVADQVASHPEVRRHIQEADERNLTRQPPVPRRDFPRAEPDEDDRRFQAQADQNTRLIDNRADIARVIATLQRIYERGVDSGHEVVLSDLARADKWLSAVMTLANEKPIEQELAEFLKGEQA